MQVFMLEVEAVKCECIKVEYVNTTVLVCVLCARAPELSVRLTEYGHVNNTAYWNRMSIV